MKQYILKITLSALLVFLLKYCDAQTLTANFGYTDNCRTIYLTDSSSGSKLIYSWEFGDGNSTFTKNTSHTYAVNGTFKVTLIITCRDSTSGNFLKKDTMSKLININCNTCNIISQFSTAWDPINNKKLLFINKTSGQSTYTSVWDFGYNGNGGSNATNPNHTFPSNGNFYVKLKTSYYDTSLSQTCIDSIVKKVSVHPVRANFGYIIDTTKCGKVTFSDSSKGYPNFWIWQFSDFDSYYGFDSSSGPIGKKPVFQYPVADSIQVFNVTYIAHYTDSSNSIFYIDTMRKTITIPACTKCLIKAMIDLQGDSTQTFTGILYNISTGPINKHFWNFGDGSTSTSNAPVHSYANPGQYTITYIAKDTIKNCADTTRVTFTIDSLGFLKRKAFILTVIDKTTTGLTQKETVEKAGLKVFPNPAQQYFNLAGTGQTICIYDLKGMKVMNIVLKENETLKVSTDGWAKGLYLIRGSGGQYVKLLVE